MIEEPLLDGRVVRHDGFGARPPFAPGGRIQGDDLLDAREAFEDSDEAEPEAGVPGLPVERQGQHAVKAWTRIFWSVQ